MHACMRARKDTKTAVGMYIKGKERERERDRGEYHLNDHLDKGEMICKENRWREMV